MYLSRVKEGNSHTQGSKHIRAETTEQKLDNLLQDNGPHNLLRNSMSGICDRFYDISSPKYSTKTSLKVILDM